MDIILFIIIIVQFFAILIICVRTSYLKSITNTLSRIEKQLEQGSKRFSEIHPEKPASSKSPEPQMSDEELMSKYGITLENDIYHFKTYKYDRLRDAVNYAKQQKE